jgi:hypothetical protein
MAKEIVLRFILINKQQEKVYVEYPERLGYLHHITAGNAGTTAQRFSSSTDNPQQ